MAKDRAHDTSRVYQNPISHVNVLPNEHDSGEYGSHDIKMQKNGKGRGLAGATGATRFKTVGATGEGYDSTVSLRGGFGVATEAETANQARQYAYNDASADAVNKRKEITKKGAEDIERKNKGRGKAKVIKVKS